MIAATAVMLAWAGWLVISHAWFSDDAYFTFRTVDNFVNGYGLTWNVAERVQVYTHPLWMFLLSGIYFFTHEIYLTSIFTSLLITLAIVPIMIFGLAHKPWQGIAAVFLLTLSSAFIDYSSSGLENPISHLLYAAFLLIFFRKESSPRKLFWLAFVASLAAVNRLDTALFYFPPLLLEWWGQPNKWRGVGMLALGFLPLVAWEVFSIIYYGFPFPNTYYAKAHNYVELVEVISAGLTYYGFTLLFDTITWIVIVAGIATVFVQRARRGMAVAAGILLYLVYIPTIGGDFMGGRFLSTAYVGGVILLLVFLFPRLKLAKHWWLLPAVLLISLLAASPTYFLYPLGFEKTRWPLHGLRIVDERMEYYTTSFVRIDTLHAFIADPQHNWLNDVAFVARSIWRGTAFRTEVEHDWADRGTELRERAEREGSIATADLANGFTGFYAGPDVFFIQELALTDPFLARIPPIYYPNWRAGHFNRQIPNGYLEVEQGNAAHLEESQLDEYFQKIRLVTRGDLFTRERWAAIWELNTRGFNDFLPGYEESLRFPQMATIPAETSAQSIETDGYQFVGRKGAGLQIEFSELIHPLTLEIELGAGDSFQIFYLDKDGEVIGTRRLISRQLQGVETYELEVPKQILEPGISAIRILPIRAGFQLADGDYTFFALRWDD